MHNEPPVDGLLYPGYKQWLKKVINFIDITLNST